MFCCLFAVLSVGYKKIKNRTGGVYDLVHSYALASFRPVSDAHVAVIAVMAAY